MAQLRLKIVKCNWGKMEIIDILVIISLAIYKKLR